MGVQGCSSSGGTTTALGQRRGGEGEAIKRRSATLTCYLATELDSISYTCTSATMTTQKRRLKVALFGLGRLGVIRAKVLAFQQPRVELVAVCDPKPGSEKWPAENLPSDVKFFADPTECLVHGGAEAVLISTATATHAPLIMQALDLGLHVMCEKPISIDLDTTVEVLAKAATRPDVVFLIPFNRRYDDSYNTTKQFIESGALGDVHAVETSCLDPQDPTGYFVSYSPMSGGIFLDMGIHDIDIGRGLLDVKSGLANPKKQVNRVIGFGQQAVYGELAKYGDCDNAWGIVEFANGKIMTTHCGRTLTNGYEGQSRVLGTKGHCVVNGNSSRHRVEMHDVYGVRTFSNPDPFVLYEKSFINDITDFVEGVLDGKPLVCDAQDAYEAAKICNALQYSFRKGQPVYFDDEGYPIMDAK
ncbi:NAD binding Rossmann fold oxidoreductase [Limtongia smithiae]|uniref:NAD binding Rossmann fold oxidoreductase n=1 Tax=Limtongia smithiae TaxID=1125753 RepID=UPI0034CD7DF7